MLKTPESIAVNGTTLYDRLSGFDPALLDADARVRLLDRFFAARAGRERPGRYWRIDLDAVAPDPDSIAASGGNIRIENAPARAIACDLQSAAKQHPNLLFRAFGVTGARATKFGALAGAFAQLGAFVYLPADTATHEPITVTYDIPRETSVFPYTVVLAERGAQATIVERFAGGADAFVCGIAEVVTDESAAVTYAACQQLAAGAQALFTRSAAPGRDTTVAWACAELGASLAVADLSVSIGHPGTRADVTVLFFPNQTQHVDVVSTVDHTVGDSTSQTLVKTAAVDAGQARYLGNIRIARNAQGSDASLRDDALLLSEKAHVDSVPALEIGANDVKAFHGATVGALDAEQVFYMQTRGIERHHAERMIALGFFEPAIARFPKETLRECIREALAGKLP